MASFRNGNAEVYYEIRGEGPALIMLAGLGSDSQSWSTVSNRLAKYFTLLMPDNRGCGRTKCPADEITLSGIASDMLSLMDHLGIKTAHLLGHSMGGCLAQQLCTAQAQRFDRLVLAATTAKITARNINLLNSLVKYREDGMDLREWFRCLYYWIFTRSFFENEKMLELSLDYSLNYPYPQSAEQFKKQVQLLSQFDSSGRLKEITQQTLILCASEDILFPVIDSTKFLSAIPNAQTTIIEDAAHGLFVEQPKAFVDAIVKFLL